MSNQKRAKKNSFHFPWLDDGFDDLSSSYIHTHKQNINDDDKLINDEKKKEIKQNTNL